MRRREVLATFTAAVPAMAGCSALDFARGSESPPDSTVTPAPVPSPSPPPPENSPTPGEPPPEWASVLADDDLSVTSIIDLDTIPRTYALAPAHYRSNDDAIVRMAFVETATEDHPARLVASFQNANQFENTFELDWTPPFGRLASEPPRPADLQHPPRGITYRDTLAFVPTSNHELVERPPEVELADDGIWRHDGSPASGFPERIRLDPNETVYGEYYLAGHPEGRNTGRPPGIYEFSRGREASIRIAVWNTETPGPQQRSELEGISVPPVSGRNPTAWYHDANPGAPTFVKPSVERTGFPAAIDFTYINHSKSSTECGHWNLYKLVNGQWFHLGPYLHTADCRIVHPGGGKTWTLHAFHGEGLDTREAHTVDYLGGGRYAAIVGFGHATSHSGAVVELVGGATSIVPTDDVTSDRSGDTVTVTDPEWNDEEPPGSATVTLTRTDGADRTLITEQVMRGRFRGLRNTLAFFEENVEQVVYRTTEQVAENIVGFDADVRRFRIESSGEAYRAEIERLGSP